MTVREVYYGSSGEATTALYKRLEALGPRGLIAMNLFRACKASERAKKYTRRFRGTAYDKKNWSLSLLCDALAAHAETLGIRFGWRQDDNPPVGYPWVLYIDLPTGQASFHSAARGKGPDYPDDWDSRDTSANRIIAWTCGVLGEPVADELAPVTLEQTEFIRKQIYDSKPDRMCPRCECRIDSMGLCGCESVKL